MDMHEPPPLPKPRRAVRPAFLILLAVVAAGAAGYLSWYVRNVGIKEAVAVATGNTPKPVSEEYIPLPVRDVDVDKLVALHSPEWQEEHRKFETSVLAVYDRENSKDAAWFQ